MFNKKRKHFKKMEQEITQVIWEKELSKFTLLQEREMARQHYDRIMQGKVNLEERMKVAGKDEIKDLKVQKAAMEKTAEDLQKELDTYNTKIDGGAPSEAVPEGSIGVTNELQKWAERREIIKAFIKLNT